MSLKNIKKLYGYITLGIALTISVVAAWYSIVGLVTIFSASPIPIIIMGAVLETGKIATVAWLHYYWRVAPYFIRLYLCIAVGILMFITSMGIFGFLSKAHIEQNNSAVVINDQLDRIDYEISVERARIERIDNTMLQLDASIDKYIELGALTKGLKQRDDQKGERDQLDSLRNETQNNIDNLTSQRYIINQQLRNVELEIGPIKYIAALLYNSDDITLVENAVRWVILLLVFVFDPLAVMMLIAAQYTFKPSSNTTSRTRATTNSRRSKKNKINVASHVGANAEVVRTRKTVDNTDNIAIINNEGLG